MDKGIRSDNEEVAKDIVRAVNSIKFGYVQVIVQDSKVIQIEKTEKIRLGNSSFKKEELRKP